MTLKLPQYETLEEAQQRLLNTVVLYDNEPVFITKIGHVEKPGDDRFRVYAVPLTSLDKVNWEDEQFRKLISSKKFDMAPPPMGYVSTPKQAIFVARTTRRQYVQGTSKNNTTLLTPNGEALAYNFDGLVRMKNFSDMLQKKYPSFEETMDYNKKHKPSSVALSQQFAISKPSDKRGEALDFGLFYVYRGTEPIGIMMEGDKGIRVGDKFKFLRQELEEQRIKIA